VRVCLNRVKGFGAARGIRLEVFDGVRRRRGGGQS